MARKAKLDHNLKQTPAVTPHEDPFIRLGGNAAGALKGHVEKLESLHQGIVDLRADIKAVKLAAKADGFDARALDIVVKARRVDDEIRIALDEQVRKMKEALGMPTLFDYAERQERREPTEDDADLEAMG